MAFGWCIARHQPEHNDEDIYDHYMYFAHMILALPDTECVSYSKYVHTVYQIPVCIMYTGRYR